MKKESKVKEVKPLFKTSQRVIIKLLIFCVWLSTAFAADPIKWDHVPPVVDQSSFKNSLPIRLGGTGIKRARVLVGAKTGYKVISLSKVGDYFDGGIRFEDLAVIKYQFQVETDEGNILESSYYTVRQPSNDELESRLVELRKEAEGLEAKVLQLENAMQGIKAADPSEFAKRKNSELARAYVRLGRAERSLSESDIEITNKEKTFLKAALLTEQGKATEEARRFLVEEGERYFGK